MTDKPFALSARVILRDGQGRILLLKRAAGLRFCPGKWEFPGGKAEPGEAFQGTLLRETEEETGLDVSLTGAAGLTEFELPAHRIACVLMDGQAGPGPVRLSVEHEQYAWVPADRLLEYDLAEHLVRFVRSLVAGQS